MIPKNKSHFLVMLLSLSLFGLLATRSQTEPKVNTKDIMKFKLHYAQSVLEGIATENFSLIATNAQKLKRLSQSADWQLRQTPDYQKFTADFARQADALGKAAKDSNVDLATVAYFQLTVSCVNCHKHLKGRDVAQSEPAPPGMQARLLGRARVTSP